MPRCINILRMAFILSILSMCIISSVFPNMTYSQTHKWARGSAREGKLTGRVMRGPICPVVREGIPCPPEPAPNVRLVIVTPAGQEIIYVMTNEEGAYSVSLPPGVYRIETTSLTGIEFSKDLPATVIITEGRETRFDVHIDTGIR